MLGGLSRPNPSKGCSTWKLMRLLLCKNTSQLSPLRTMKQLGKSLVRLLLKLVLHQVIDQVEQHIMYDGGMKSGVRELFIGCINSHQHFFRRNASNYERFTLEGAINKRMNSEMLASLQPWMLPCIP